MFVYNFQYRLNVKQKKSTVNTKNYHTIIFYKNNINQDEKKDHKYCFYNFINDDIFMQANILSETPRIYQN